MIRTCTSLLVATIATTVAPAVETELQLGPNDSLLSVGLVDAYLLEGALRSDDVALTGEARGRYENIGLGIRGILAIGDDETRDVEHFDLLEMEIRADYLVELEGQGQLIPHYQTSFFPYQDNADEPHWLGLDGWYFLPLEGMEVGGSIDMDIGGEWGWFLEAGARQFIQDADLSLDLRLWQVIGYGDEDFHRYTTGVDEAGLTTLEVGAKVSVPLPWEASWVTLTIEGHWWLSEDDRDALEDDAELILGLGLDYRPAWW